MVLVAVVLVAATLALVAAVGLVARDPDRPVGWLRAGGITVTKVATRFINWFDRSVKKAAGGRLFAAIGSLAKWVLPDREHDAWVGGRAPRPVLTGVLLATLVVMVTLGQMNHLVAGMHPQTEARPTSMAALTGGPWGSVAADMQTHVAMWIAWECEDLGRTECTTVARPAWAVAPGRLHESPRTVAGWYLILDMVFIAGYVLVLGWALLTTWRRAAPHLLAPPEVEKAPGKSESEHSSLPRRQLWQRAVSVLGVLLAVGAIADVVENLMLWWVIESVGASTTAAAVAWFAAKLKIWTLLAVVVGLIYTTLFRPRPRPLVEAGGRPAPERPVEGPPLAQRLGEYVRGLPGVRVGGLVVLFVWLLLFGPMFADQMLDVIRRWNWVHALVVVSLTMIITVFVGASTRRVYLRRALGLRRWTRDPGATDDVCAVDARRLNGDAETEYLRHGHALRAAVTIVILALAIAAGVLALFADAALKGLVVPAAVVALLAVAGWPLENRDDVHRPPDASRPIISPFAPRLLAAAVPTIVGLGILRAVVPDFALDATQSWTWVVAPVVAVTTGVGGYRMVEDLRARLVADRALAGCLQRHILIAALLVIAAVVIVVGLADAPATAEVLHPAVLLVIGLTVVAAAHTTFYFFADPPIRPCDPDLEEAQKRPGPASVLPGLAGFDRRPRGGDGQQRDDEAALEQQRDDPQHDVDVGAQQQRNDQGGDATGRAGWKLLLWLPTIPLVAAIVWIIWRPLLAPRVLGGVGLALLFALTFGLFAEITSRFVERTPAPKVLQHIGIRRTPAFTILAIWVVLMASVLHTPSFHDVQLKDVEPRTAGDVPTISSAFDRWIVNQELPARGNLPEATAADGRRRAVPMVFVSAWGGGIRAGVWTAYVLDCAFEPHDDGRPWQLDGQGERRGPCRVEAGSAATSIAAMSGISGGSLGFAEYAAHLIDDDEASHEWVRARMGDDYLAPAVGRLLFVDMPLSLLGPPSGVDDRADVLQHAWEASWRDTSDRVRDGIFELWRSEPTLPLMVMNSTSMNHACSINVSPLDVATQTDTGEEDCKSLTPFDASRRSGQDAEVVEPVGVDGTGDAHMESGRLVGTHDIESLLCADQDVTLMSAALMSARFPVVSPTGRITQCPTDDQASGVSVFTSDGGQLDPSAALTATQLWEAYEPYVVEYNRRSPNACIAPVLIHMENGFDADLAMTSSAPPNEWVDPVLWSLTDAKTGLVGNARQRMALEFSEPMAGPRAAMTLVDTSAGYDQSAEPLSRVAYIRTRAHPGSSAPLGWTLSHTTLQDLAQQLGQNRAEFTRVHQWLSGDIACEPIPRNR